MVENTESTADSVSVSRRTILRSTAIGVLGGGSVTSSVSAQPDELIGVEPSILDLGMCGDPTPNSFEVFLTLGRGRTEIDVSSPLNPGMVDESFTLGGPNPTTKTVIVAPTDPIFTLPSIVVTATRGGIEDQKTVSGSCEGLF